MIAATAEGREVHRDEDDLSAGNVEGTTGEATAAVREGHKVEASRTRGEEEGAAAEEGEEVAEIGVEIPPLPTPRPVLRPLLHHLPPEKRQTNNSTPYVRGTAQPPATPFPSEPPTRAEEPQESSRGTSSSRQTFQTPSSSIKREQLGEKKKRKRKEKRSTRHRTTAAIKIEHTKKDSATHSRGIVRNKMNFILPGIKTRNVIDPISSS